MMNDRIRRTACTLLGCGFVSVASAQTTAVELPASQSGGAVVQAVPSPIQTGSGGPVSPSQKCSDFGAMMEQDFQGAGSPEAAEHVNQFRVLVEAHLPPQPSELIMRAFTQEIVGYCASNGQKTLGDAITASVAAVNFAIRQATSEQTLRNERRGPSKPPVRVMTGNDAESIQRPASPSREGSLELPSTAEKPAVTEQIKRSRKEDAEPSLPQEPVGGTVTLDGTL